MDSKTLEENVQSPTGIIHDGISQIEGTFWVALLALCTLGQTFYWKVLFVTSVIARGSFLVAAEINLYRPPTCNTLPEAILWSLWLTAGGTCFITCLYLVFLSPLHLLWSPVDLWAKYESNPTPNQAYDVLHDPGLFTRAELIAVHGLGSNPKTAWTHKNSPSATPVRWLKDLLPQDSKLKAFKVIQVNHQTAWHAHVSPTAFDDHARNLLRDIESAHEFSGRPIVFVAHSFGGLLLKRALIIAKGKSSSIVDDTRGILFLGVPHLGTEAAFWGSLLSCTAQWRGSSTTLLQYMNERSDPIQVLQEDFRDGFVTRRHNMIQHLPYICDFVEMRSERRGKLAFGATVNRQSGNSGYGYTDLLNTDHRGLNKFGSLEDPNYLKVKGHLLGALEYALKTSTLIQNIEPSHNVPFDKDHHFVERTIGTSSVVEEIYNSLLNFPHHKRMALVGLGGMGKSQIAIEFSYLVRDKCPDIWVFWVQAGSKIKFESSFCEIAQQVGLVSASDVDKRAVLPDLVLKWLKNEYNGRWVMILDGADNLNVFASTDSSEPPVSHLIPRVNHGSVLITSRVRTTALRIIATPDQFNNVINVDKMNFNEAQDLLQSRLPECLWDEESANLLLKELSYIPLAITQAAAVINYNVIESIADYHDRFLMGLAQLESVPDPRREQDSSSAVFVTWRLSFEAIKKASSSAIDLLSYMSVLDNERIPRSLLVQYQLNVFPDSEDREDPVTQKYLQRGKANRENNTEAETSSSDSSPKPSTQQSSQVEWWYLLNDEFESDMRLLSDYAMIQLEKDGLGYNMHHLVQEAMSDWLQEQGDDMVHKYQMKAVANISMAFPMNTFDSINTASTIYKHAERALKYSCTDRNSKLHRAELCYRMSSYCAVTGSRFRAMALSEESLQIRKEVFGSGRGFFGGHNICTTRSLSQYAGYLINMHDNEKAERLSKEALDGWSMSIGFDQSLKNDLKYNLTVSLFNQSKLDEAARVFETLRDQDSVSCKRLKGTIFEIRGKWKEAEEIYREVIDSVHAQKSRNHHEFRELVICQRRLAECLKELGQVEEALKLLRDAIRPAFINLGPYEPNTIHLMNGLASIEALMKNEKEAESVARGSVELSKTFYDADDPILYDSLRELCAALEEQKRWKDIEDVLSDADFPNRTPRVSKSDSYWILHRVKVSSLQWQGKFEETQTACKQMIDYGVQVYGPHSGHHAQALIMVADCFLDMGKLDLAQDQLNQVAWCLEREGSDFIIAHEWCRLVKEALEKKKAEQG